MSFTLVDFRESRVEVFREIDHPGIFTQTLSLSCSHLFIFSRHADADECLLDTDDCVQACNNTVGSFACDCFQGYRLSTDLKSCEGNQFDIFNIITRA